jgi:hypothetical protein
MDNRSWDRLVGSNMTPEDKSTRSHASRLMEARQISQRQMWGEIRNGARSIHDPRNWF